MGMGASKSCSLSTKVREGARRSTRRHHQDAAVFRTLAARCVIARCRNKADSPFETMGKRVAAGLAEQQIRREPVFRYIDMAGQGIGHVLNARAAKMLS